MPFFTIQTKSKQSLARTGTLEFSTGTVSTPCFMPIGTAGSVKSLTYIDLETLAAPIILGNTYHLWLRPQMEVIQKAGGLHSFIHWNHPILTDSGGFQAFSLSKIRKFSEEGVTFRSQLNGAKMFLSPEISMRIQTTIGSDIALVLDECLPAEVTEREAKRAMHRTFRWAKRSKVEWESLHQAESKQKHYLFGIPQGAQFNTLRKESAKLTMELDFPGYSIGGVANGGEPEEIMYEQVLSQTQILEETKPRHLLGVGTPKDIIEMVKRGIDMFDCVYPTRNARHGSLFIWLDKDSLQYECIKIESRRYEFDFESLNPESKFAEIQNCSKSYLRHLFKAKELLAFRIATLHNLEFYLELMRLIRTKIELGTL